MATEQFEIESLSLITGDEESEEIRIFPFSGNPRTLGAEAPEGSLMITKQGVIHQKIGPGPTEWTGGSPAGESNVEAMANYLDRHSFFRDDEVVFDSNSYLEEYISDSFTAKHEAEYRFVLTFVWDLDSTSNDFEAQLVIDGDDVLNFRMEPKDKNNQKIVNTFHVNKDLTIGNHSVIFRFGPDSKNKDATVFQATITVERFI